MYTRALKRAHEQPTHLGARARTRRHTLVRLLGKLCVYARGLVHKQPVPPGRSRARARAHTHTHAHTHPQVSPKTIRDIWNRRTWNGTTARLCPEPTPDQVSV